jgi:hypothetical protein
MQLDLNTKFLELDGTESIQNITMGQLLAQQLATTKGKLNPLKTIPWALELFKGVAIEIDKVDLNSLIDFIETINTITPLAAYQLLEKLKKISSE